MNYARRSRRVATRIAISPSAKTAQPGAIEQSMGEDRPNAPWMDSGRTHFAWNASTRLVENGSQPQLKRRERAHRQTTPAHGRPPAAIRIAISPPGKMAQAHNAAGQA